MDFITGSAAETRAVAQKIIEESSSEKRRGALVLALKGELGSGKTTFLQGLANALGVKENVLSPTFVIMKKYPLRPAGDFYHFDCYRLEDSKEVSALGFGEIIKEPKNIVAIEWAEKIKKILPRGTIWLEFEHQGGDKRKIKM